jgi:hypothetical protein
MGAGGGSGVVSLEVDLSALKGRKALGGAPGLAAVQDRRHVLRPRGVAVPHGRRRRRRGAVRARQVPALQQRVGAAREPVLRDD